MDTRTEAGSDITKEPGFFWPTLGKPGLVPLWALIPTPNQPRKHFDKDGLKILADTMGGGKQREIIPARELTPAEKKEYAPARYMIKSGERRWRSADLAELPGVEIRVKEYESEAEEALDTFMLNENRIGLSDIENARYLLHLMKLHGWKTQQQVADGIGKDQAWVAQHMALLKCSPKVQARMEPSVDEEKRFVRSVGVFLARFTHEEQDRLVSRLPPECTVGARQIAWMTADLKEQGVVLETRQRSPAEIQRRLNNLSKRINAEAENLLTASDFGKLFNYTSPEIRHRVLHTLRTAYATLG